MFRLRLHSAHSCEFGETNVAIAKGTKANASVACKLRLQRVKVEEDVKVGSSIKLA